MSDPKPQDLALVLQRVICPVGLGASELATKLEDLGPFAQLKCVQARMQGPHPLDCARAIVSVVKEALTRLEDGPGRRAVELLIGAGRTWGLLRKDRRKAAAEALVVGEVHFRKYRELPLLVQLAEQVCALEAECAAECPQPGFGPPAGEAAEERHDADQEIVITHAPEPSRRHVRRWLWRAGIAALLLMVSTLVIRIWMTRGGGPAGGENGQQISYCPKEVSAHGTAYVTGANQAGNVILNHPVSLSGSCGLQTGWWWVGNVDIAWDDSSGHLVGATTCYVPQKQKSRDWVSCYAPH